MPRKKTPSRVKGLTLQRFAELYVEHLNRDHSAMLAAMMKEGEYRDEDGAKRALYSFKRALAKKAEAEGKHLSLPKLPGTPDPTTGSAPIKWGDLAKHVPSLAKFLAPPPKQTPSLAK